MSKKILYIGYLSQGATSCMRAENLRTILSNWEFDIIDIDIPLRSASRIFRSLGFRYKIGPLINRINTYVVSQLSKKEYDVIWVDKAVYIKPETTQKLQFQTKLLIHFTPDPAFSYHRSRLFFDSIKMYDYVITTKSFEVKDYESFVPKGKIIYVTQGFSKKLHRCTTPFSQKKNEVIFVGHCEKLRAEVVDFLLKSNIKVSAGGRGWKKFQRKKKFTYLGEGIYGEDYVALLNRYLFALGFISKWIPETHTTRTFEIPACGTALLTESNDEIRSFFSDQEVVFYKDKSDLVKKIKFYQKHPNELEVLSDKGRRKVISGGYDYQSILSRALGKILG